MTGSRRGSSFGGSACWPRLWLADLDACAPGLEAIAASHRLIPSAIEAPTHADDRRKRVARLALRTILATEVGLERARQPFVFGPAGKPALQPAPGPGAFRQVSFSIAHSEHLALIALADGDPVGVDIEGSRQVRISADRRRLLEAAAQRLAPERALPDGPPDRRFLQSWVRLEALAKATGEGISALFGRLDLRGRLASPEQGGPEEGGPERAWIVSDVCNLPVASFYAAVAVSQTGRTAGSGSCPLQILPVATEQLT